MLLWELFLCFTCSHHFCSIVSDISSNMQRSRITCSNCGVVGVTTDPCEFCRMLPQCRKCRRRLPSRCFVKSTTANICEVSHVLSVWTFLILHFNKLVSLYYKFLHMLCRIAMRGSCDTKSWRRDSAGGETRRTRVRNPFRRLWLSGLPPSQRRDNSQSSRGLAPSTRVHMILLYNNNNNNNYDSFDCYIESVYR